MNVRSKSMSWVGNLCEKFETMCHEVDNIVRQDTVKYVENQVQTMGDNMKHFYTTVQDIIPDRDSRRLAANKRNLRRRTSTKEVIEDTGCLNQSPPKPVESDGLKEGKENSFRGLRIALRSNDPGSGEQMASITPRTYNSMTQNFSVSFEENATSNRLSGSEQFAPNTCVAESSELLFEENEPALYEEQLSIPGIHDDSMAQNFGENFEENVARGKPSASGQMVPGTCVAEPSESCSEENDLPFEEQLKKSMPCGISRIHDHSMRQNFSESFEENIARDKPSANEQMVPNTCVIEFSEPCLGGQFSNFHHEYRRNFSSAKVYDPSMLKTLEGSIQENAKNETQSPVKLFEPIVFKNESPEAHINSKTSDYCWDNLKGTPSEILFLISDDEEMSNFHQFTVTDKADESYEQQSLEEAMVSSSYSRSLLPPRISNSNIINTNSRDSSRSSALSYSTSLTSSSNNIPSIDTIGFSRSSGCFGGNNLEDSRMETIDLTDKAQLDENSLTDEKMLHEVARRTRRLRSYKKKIQDALTLKRRLAKEYEQLAIWHGDSDMESGEVAGRMLKSSTVSIKLDSDTKSNQTCYSEWELL